MKSSGCIQILTVSYVMLLCCLTSALTNEITQVGQIMQKNAFGQMSRRETLQLLSSLLELNEYHNLGQDLDDRSVPEEDVYQADSKVVSSERQASGERVSARKRQRPCFWSVVTCY